MSKDVPLAVYDTVFRDDVLAGKFAFVTGGGSGINFRITEAFMRHGCDVAIASRSVDRVKVASERLRAKYPERRCLYFGMDVTDDKQVAVTVSAILKQYPRIDILVNGAAGNFLCLAEQLTAGGMRRVFEIDTFGSFYASREVFAQTMRDSSHPSVIINISATLSRNGTLYQMHSGAAKAAIDAMTRHLAVEWGKFNVRVVGVAPGPIQGTEGFDRLGGFAQSPAALSELKSAPFDFGTGMPLGRSGTKKEIADACVFLASDSSAFTTGTVLVIDGAQNMYSANDMGRILQKFPGLLEMAPQRSKKKATSKL